MNLFKTFLLTLLAIFLTGCYTQLQLSESGGTKKSSYAESYEKEAGTQDYVYKNKMLFYSNDYNYGRYWGDSFYYTPEFYESYWYHYGNGVSYSYLSGRLYFGPEFYGTRFTFAISPLSPFYYRHYDPFYYRHYGPFAYNYINYYNSGGYGYVEYNKESKDVRYGPRSIGTNRVATNVNRSRSSGDISRRSTSINSASRKSVVRSRGAVGTSRTKGSVNRTRGTVKRNSSGKTVDRNQSRVRSNNNGSANNRTRGSIIRENRKAQANSTSSGITRVRSINLGDQLSKQWISNYRNIQLKKAKQPAVDQNKRSSSHSFFKRVRGILKNSTGPINRKIDLGNTSVRSRFETTSRRPSTINRNTSSKSRGTTVNRSRSSSSSNSKSRSRGSSSSSGNSRSRGNG